MVGRARRHPRVGGGGSARRCADRSRQAARWRGSGQLEAPRHVRRPTGLSGRPREGGAAMVVGLLEFGWRDVAAGLEQAAVIEPVDPLQGGDLDLLNGPPRAARLDQLGLQQPGREPRSGAAAHGPGDPGVPRVLDPARERRDGRIGSGVAGTAGDASATGRGDQWAHHRAAGIGGAGCSDHRGCSGAHGARAAAQHPGRRAHGAGRHQRARTGRRSRGGVQPSEHHRHGAGRAALESGQAHTGAVRRRRNAAVLPARGVRPHRRGARGPTAAECLGDRRSAGFAGHGQRRRAGWAGRAGCARTVDRVPPLADPDVAAGAGRPTVGRTAVPDPRQ